MKSTSIKKGFTIIEVMLGLAVFILIGLAIFAFQSSVLRTENILSGSLDASYEASKAVKILAKEIREAKDGKDGSYPISVTNGNEFVFFSDINNDGNTEKIRYFLDNRHLKKQISFFSGNPPSYDNYSEPEDVINYLINDVNPIFEYYDGNYDGTSEPLTDPFSVFSVRLVKIRLEIDKDDSKAPAPIVAETNISIRNLKDNI